MELTSDKPKIPPAINIAEKKNLDRKATTVELLQLYCLVFRTNPLQ